MIDLLINLLILGCVLGLVWWLMDYLPIPEPFNKIIKVVCIVVFIIYLLTMLGGVDVPRLRIQ